MRELQRLEAEEALQQIECVAAGSGLLRPADRRQIVNRLQRLARNDHNRPQLSKEQGALMLAAVGVKVCRKRSARQS